MIEKMIRSSTFLFRFDVSSTETDMRGWQKIRHGDHRVAGRISLADPRGNWRPLEKASLFLKMVRIWIGTMEGAYPCFMDMLNC
jgi:hypothetical protein